MQLPIPRFFVARRPWVLFVVLALLLSAAFAADAVAPDAQDVPPPPNCIEDAAGRALQCTANDVEISRYILVEGPDECQLGETIKVKLQAELRANAQDRYDIGLYIAQDGGNARRGSCYRDFLAPPLASTGYDPGTLFAQPTAGDPPAYTGGGPFLTSEEEPDTCGDIAQGVLTYRDVGELLVDGAYADTGPIEIEIECQDNVDSEGNPGADLVADVDTCVSWDNQSNQSPACTSAAGAVPNTPAKCRCASVPIAGLPVAEGASLEVIKRLIPPDDPGKFDLLIDGVVRSGDEGAGDGGSTGPIAVSAGTQTNPGAYHTVGEAAHPDSGTDLGAYEISYVCENAEKTKYVSGTGSDPVTVQLMPDEEMVCTFTNKAIEAPRPRLRLVKTMEIKYGGTATAADFQASVSDGVTITNVDWDTFVELDPGVYDAGETALAGYTPSAWAGDCAADGKITLQPGDEKTCTITNSDSPRPPSDGKTICVDGYVINHREKPVDGTQTVPPLVVEAWLGENDLGLPANQLFATAPAGEDGYFKFTGLPEGMWDFRLPMAGGWEGIVPIAEIDGVAVTGFTKLEESKTCHRIVFKIRRLVTIPVMKWEERLDGTVVPGEDWLIMATPMKDPFAKVVTATVKNGSTLLNLTPGTWTIAETLKTGWTPLLPQTVTRGIDQYAPPNEVQNPVVFKNREPICYGSIRITKIGFGPDENGQPQALGTLPGWEYTVRRADKTQPGTSKTTDGSGTVEFKHLTPGVYKVLETEQPGWDTDANPRTVVLTGCEMAEVTFENYEHPGELKITGKKLFRAWEKPYKGSLVGLAGWKITAQLVGTEQIASAVTNVLGEYEFTTEALQNAGMGFPGATIEVCEEDRDHWIHVTPECVRVRFPYPVPLGYGGEVVNFINAQDPPPAGGAASGAASAAGACGQTYTIAAGDTLAAIAARHGVSLESLISANGIRNADRIYAGQRLCIR